MRLDNYHLSFEDLHVGTMQTRAYYIPFPNRKDLYEARRASADYIEMDLRYASDRVQMLDGDWDFRYYNRPEEVPEDFPSLDFQGDGFTPPIHECSLSLPLRSAVCPPRESLWRLSDRLRPDGRRGRAQPLSVFRRRRQ